MVGRAAAAGVGQAVGTMADGAVGPLMMLCKEPLRTDEALSSHYLDLCADPPPPGSRSRVRNGRCPLAEWQKGAHGEAVSLPGTAQGAGAGSAGVGRGLRGGRPVRRKGHGDSSGGPKGEEESDREEEAAKAKEAEAAEAPAVVVPPEQVASHKAGTTVADMVAIGTCMDESMQAHVCAEIWRLSQADDSDPFDAMGHFRAQLLAAGHEEYEVVCIVGKVRQQLENMAFSEYEADSKRKMESVALLKQMGESAERGKRIAEKFLDGTKTAFYGSLCDRLGETGAGPPKEIQNNEEKALRSLEACMTGLVSVEGAVKSCQNFVTQCEVQAEEQEVEVKETEHSKEGCEAMCDGIVETRRITAEKLQRDFGTVGKAHLAGSLESKKMLEATKERLRQRKEVELLAMESNREIVELKETVRIRKQEVKDVALQRIQMKGALTTELEELGKRMSQLKRSMQIYQVHADEANQQLDEVLVVVVKLEQEAAARARAKEMKRKHESSRLAVEAAGETLEDLHEQLELKKKQVASYQLRCDYKKRLQELHELQAKAQTIEASNDAKRASLQKVRAWLREQGQAGCEEPADGEDWPAKPLQLVTPICLGRVFREASKRRERWRQRERDNTVRRFMGDDQGEEVSKGAAGECPDLGRAMPAVEEALWDARRAVSAALEGRPRPWSQCLCLSSSMPDLHDSHEHQRMKGRTAPAEQQMRAAVLGYQSALWQARVYSAPLEYPWTRIEAQWDMLWTDLHGLLYREGVDRCNGATKQPTDGLTFLKGWRSNALSCLRPAIVDGAQSVGPLRRLHAMISSLSKIALLKHGGASAGGAGAGSTARTGVDEDNMHVQFWGEVVAPLRDARNAFVAGMLALEERQRAVASVIAVMHQIVRRDSPLAARMCELAEEAEDVSFLTKLLGAEGLPDAGGTARTLRGRQQLLLLKATRLVEQEQRLRAEADALLAPGGLLASMDAAPLINPQIDGEIETLAERARKVLEASRDAWKKQWELERGPVKVKGNGDSFLNVAKQALPKGGKADASEPEAQAGLEGQASARPLSPGGGLEGQGEEAGAEYAETAWASEAGAIGESALGEAAAVAAWDGLATAIEPGDLEAAGISSGGDSPRSPKRPLSPEEAALRSGAGSSAEGAAPGSHGSRGPGSPYRPLSPEEAAEAEARGLGASSAEAGSTGGPEDVEVMEGGGGPDDQSGGRIIEKEDSTFNMFDRAQNKRMPKVRRMNTSPPESLDMRQQKKGVPSLESTDEVGASSGPGAQPMSPIGEHRTAQDQKGKLMNKRGTRQSTLQRGKRPSPKVVRGHPGEAPHSPRSPKASSPRSLGRQGTVKLGTDRPIRRNTETGPRSEVSSSRHAEPTPRVFSEESAAAEQGHGLADVTFPEAEAIPEEEDEAEAMQEGEEMSPRGTSDAASSPRGPSPSAEDRQRGPGSPRGHEAAEGERGSSEGGHPNQRRRMSLEEEGNSSDSAGGAGVGLRAASLASTVGIVGMAKRQPHVKKRFSEPVPEAPRVSSSGPVSPVPRGKSSTWQFSEPPSALQAGVPSWMQGIAGAARTSPTGEEFEGDEDSEEDEAYLRYQEDDGVDVERDRPKIIARSKTWALSDSSHSGALQSPTDNNHQSRITSRGSTGQIDSHHQPHLRRKVRPAALAPKKKREPRQSAVISGAYNSAQPHPSSDDEDNDDEDDEIVESYSASATDANGSQEEVYKDMQAAEAPLPVASERHLAEAERCHPSSPPGYILVETGASVIRESLIGLEPLLLGWEPDEASRLRVGRKGGRRRKAGAELRRSSPSRQAPLQSEMDARLKQAALVNMGPVTREEHHQHSYIPTGSKSGLAGQRARQQHLDAVGKSMRVPSRMQASQSPPRSPIVASAPSPPQCRTASKDSKRSKEGSPERGQDGAVPPWAAYISNGGDSDMTKSRPDSPVAARRLPQEWKRREPERARVATIPTMPRTRTMRASPSREGSPTNDFVDEEIYYSGQLQSRQERVEEPQRQPPPRQLVHTPGPDYVDVPLRQHLQQRAPSAIDYVDVPLEDLIARPFTPSWVQGVVERISACTRPGSVATPAPGYRRSSFAEAHSDDITPTPPPLTWRSGSSRLSRLGIQGATGRTPTPLPTFPAARQTSQTPQYQWIPTRGLAAKDQCAPQLDSPTASRSQSPSRSPRRSPSPKRSPSPDSRAAQRQRTPPPLRPQTTEPGEGRARRRAEVPHRASSGNDAAALASAGSRPGSRGLFVVPANRMPQLANDEYSQAGDRRPNSGRLTPQVPGTLEAPTPHSGRAGARPQRPAGALSARGKGPAEKPPALPMKADAVHSVVSRSMVEQLQAGWTKALGPCRSTPLQAARTARGGAEKFGRGLTHPALYTGL